MKAQTHRWAIDGLATEEECEALARMTIMAGQSGDGYYDNLYYSPHTNNEKFEGLDLDGAAKVL